MRDTIFYFWTDFGDGYGGAGDSEGWGVGLRTSLLHLNGNGAGDKVNDNGEPTYFLSDGSPEQPIRILLPVLSHAS